MAIESGTHEVAFPYPIHSLTWNLLSLSQAREKKGSLLSKLTMNMKKRETDTVKLKG